jgi:hypothetical protein
MNDDVQVKIMKPKLNWYRYILLLSILIIIIILLYILLV